MKTLSAAAEAAIASTVRSSRLLLEIGFGTPIRITTGDTLSWDSKTWTARPFAIPTLAISTSGAAGIRVSIANRDNALTSQFLSVNPRELTVKVWALYGDPPFVPADGIEVFSGRLDGVLEIADSIIVEAAPSMGGMGSLTSAAPGLSIVKIAGGRLPGAGDSYSWGGGLMWVQEWKLKAQQG